MLDSRIHTPISGLCQGVSPVSHGSFPSFPGSPGWIAASEDKNVGPMRFARNFWSLAVDQEGVAQEANRRTILESARTATTDLPGLRERMEVELDVNLDFEAGKGRERSRGRERDPPPPRNQVLSPLPRHRPQGQAGSIGARRGIQPARVEMSRLPCLWSQSGSIRHPSLTSSAGRCRLPASPPWDPRIDGDSFSACSIADSPEMVCT